MRKCPLATNEAFKKLGENFNPQPHRVLRFPCNLKPPFRTKLGGTFYFTRENKIQARKT